MLITSGKTVAIATVDRFYALQPRLAAFARHLRATTDRAAAATPVERALGHELLREARAVTSRDGFGRSLRLPRRDAPLTRQELLDLVGDAELALAAFATLYRDLASEDYDTDMGPAWNYSDS